MTSVLHDRTHPRTPTNASHAHHAACRALLCECERSDACPPPFPKHPRHGKPGQAHCCRSACLRPQLRKPRSQRLARHPRHLLPSQHPTDIASGLKPLSAPAIPGPPPSSVWSTAASYPSPTVQPFSGAPTSPSSITWHGARHAAIWTVKAPAQMIPTPKGHSRR